jgi:hypothetical protein
MPVSLTERVELYREPPFHRQFQNICRFCSSEAIAGFSMDAGCTCHPDDFHHVVRANPLGSMELEVDYTQDASFTAWWNAGMPSQRTGT